MIYQSLILTETSFFESQPELVKTFNKENGKMPLREMVKKVEQYREAHGIQATIKDDSILLSQLEKFGTEEEIFTKIRAVANTCA